MELAPPVDLGGTWRVAEAGEELRREFCSPDYHDDGGDRWHDMTVPGHWRSTASFADSDGPLLYRRRFDYPPPDEGTRAWLCLDGVFYQGDVWLDGDYVGDTEGYFVRRGFEITEALRARTEHLLGAEVACAPETDLTAKHNVTGVFQHWDCLDPTWNPGGIWRPVRIELTGPVRVRYLRVLCRSADVDQAVVSIRAQFDCDGFRQVVVRTSLAGVEQVVDHTLAEGANLVEWTVTVAKPELWWPHALGDALLHLLRIEVDVDGQTSHAVERRIGLRSLRWQDWTLSVNGERLFLKGANLGPTRMALGEATAEELRGDVTLAREAGLDLLRLHAHISRPELYQAADEQGMLIWQDFPLQWGYAHTVRPRAVHQAHVAVEALSHHPSVALWCAHNEPLAIDPRFDEQRSRGDVIRVLARFAAKQELPNWNKTILDRSVRRALVENDGTRPVLSHSGTLPRPGSVGGDSHLYFGWYYGDERDLPGLCRAWPRLARFVSEFGAQAVPDNAEFCEPERWPDLDWARLARTHNLQKGRFDRYVPPADFASFDEWRAATQAYQASLVKHHVETLRRLKYHPTGGFCQFALGDGHPGVTWAVLDHLRAPKAGYHALAEACRPVIVVAERPPATVRPGDAVALDVHVVSDLRVALDEVMVEARLSWPEGEHRWRWQGDIGADECERVGTAQFVVPETAGPLVLGLTLTAGEVTAANRYESTIAAPA
ncbi:MAG: glycoside hydrolase family 2 protein [Acidimicrobiales bacterium]